MKNATGIKKPNIIGSTETIIGGIDKMIGTETMIGFGSGGAPAGITKMKRNGDGIGGA